MKNQALFPSKDKSKKLKCRLLQFLFGALGFYKLDTQGASCKSCDHCICSQQRHRQACTFAQTYKTKPLLFAHNDDG